MTQFTIDQAQAVIKSVIDQAFKAGIIQNMEAAAMAANSWNMITTKLAESKQKNESEK